MAEMNIYKCRPLPDSNLNPGGTGTKQRRTIYINNADTSGQAPTYTGNAYPYVYPTTTVTKDPQVTATIGSIVVNGLNILTINGLPAYQAVADTSTGDGKCNRGHI